jgi:hypothetical protein
MCAFVGLIIVGVKQRAWSTPVHEIEQGRGREAQAVHPLILGPPMSTGRSYEQLEKPAQV